MTNEILDSRKITPAQFHILLLCFICMMLDGYEIVIISFTASPMSQEWGMGSEQLGVVFSAGLLGMTLGAMLLSSIADIYGRRLSIAIALFTIGAATVAISYIDSPNLLIALRFITGLGLGVLIAVLPALAGEYSPKTHRNFILSIMIAGTSLGSVTGGLISAWVIPEYGWRTLYLYAGITTTVAGLLFALVVPESIHYLASRRRPDSLAKINKILAHLGQTLLTELPGNTSERIESASVKSLLTPPRRKTTFLIWGAFGMGFTGTYSLISWLPKLLVDPGVSEEQSIHAVVILTFGSMLGAVSIGWMSKWWKLNHLIAISFLSSSLFILAISAVIHIRDLEIPWITLIWILSFLLGITLHGAFANLFTVALTIYPPAIRITGIGWCYGLGRGGAIISPTLAGLLLGLGISAANVLAFFAITSVLAALFVGSIKMREMN